MVAEVMGNGIHRNFLAIGLALAAATATCNAADQTVAFPTAGGLSLAATLSTPEGSPPASGWPALLMIQGSGPTDRDGNSRLLAGVKVDLFPQITAALNARGIATLRYDKRGMSANHAQMPKDKSKLPAFFDWDRFVDDAVAGCQFLASQPGIDPTRVGILGHSEGSSLALVAADRLKTSQHPVRVLVLLSGMGRTEDLVLHDQLDSIMDRQGATAEQKQAIFADNTRITKAIVQTGIVPADVPAGLAALYPAYLGPFLKGSLAVDDVSLASHFAGPVLLIYGQRDAQVSPTLDGKPLDSALTTRRGDDHQFVVIPSASHNLKQVTSDTDAGFAGPVVPQALQAISQWCGQKLSQ